MLRRAYPLRGEDSMSYPSSFSLLICFHIAEREIASLELTFSPDTNRPCSFLRYRSNCSFVFIAALNTTEVSFCQPVIICRLTKEPVL